MSVPEADAFAAELALARLGEIRAELALPRGPAKASAPKIGFEARRARLTSRRERAIDLATDGTITREDLRARLARLDAEVAKLELAASDAERAAVAHHPERRREILRDVTVLARRWARATVAQRREVLRRLAIRIVIAADAPPVIEWKSVADLAAEL